MLVKYLHISLKVQKLASLCQKTDKEEAKRARERERKIESKRAGREWLGQGSDTR